MDSYMRETLTALLIFFSSEASANTQLCNNNILKHDICAEAKRIAAEVQEHCPIRCQKRLQILSFAADTNILSQGVKLLYDRAFFERTIIQQGRSMTDMKRGDV